MIKITIRGPSGSGKTQIAICIEKWCEQHNKVVHTTFEGGLKAYDKIKPDVLIIEEK